MIAILEGDIEEPTFESKTSPEQSIADKAIEDALSLENTLTTFKGNLVEVKYNTSGEKKQAALLFNDKSRIFFSEEASLAPIKALPNPNIQTLPDPTITTASTEDSFVINMNEMPLIQDARRNAINAATFACHEADVASDGFEIDAAFCDWGMVSTGDVSDIINEAAGHFGENTSKEYGKVADYLCEQVTEYFSIGE